MKERIGKLWQTKMKNNQSSIFCYANYNNRIINDWTVFDTVQPDTVIAS